MVKSNRRILSIQSTLETTQKEAETTKADYDTEVARLRRDKSDLRSALGVLNMEVAEGKQRLFPGIGDFQQWMRDSSVNADTLIFDLAFGNCHPNERNLLLLIKVCDLWQIFMQLRIHHLGHHLIHG